MNDAGRKVMIFGDYFSMLGVMLVHRFSVMHLPREFLRLVFEKK